MCRRGICVDTGGSLPQGPTNAEPPSGVGLVSIVFHQLAFALRERFRPEDAPSPSCFELTLHQTYRPCPVMIGLEHTCQCWNRWSHESACPGRTWRRRRHLAG